MKINQLGQQQSIKPVVTIQPQDMDHLGQMQRNACYVREPLPPQVHSITPQSLPIQIQPQIHVTRQTVVTDATSKVRSELQFYDQTIPTGTQTSSSASGIGFISSIQQRRNHQQNIPQEKKAKVVAKNKQMRAMMTVQENQDTRKMYHAYKKSFMKLPLCQGSSPTSLVPQQSVKPLSTKNTNLKLCGDQSISLPSQNPVMIGAPVSVPMIASVQNNISTPRSVWGTAPTTAPMTVPSSGISVSLPVSNYVPFKGAQS